MKNAATSQLLGVVLIIAGGIAGWMGWQEKQSVSSKINQLVHSTPTDKSILLMGAGAVMLVIGLLIVGKTLRK